MFKEIQKAIENNRELIGVDKRAERSITLAVVGKNLEEFKELAKRSSKSGMAKSLGLTNNEVGTLYSVVGL